MTDNLPFFQNMLTALLDCPEDEEMDRMRAQITLESAGAEAVEAAIRSGDPYASALYRMALGDTRESLRRSLEGEAG
jgi:ketopantoate reductase